MSDKSQAAWPFSSPELFQSLSSWPFMDIQRRNMEAVTRTSSKVAAAISAIANREMAAFSALRSATPSQRSTGDGSVGDFMSAQIQASHDAIEKSISEMRAVSDAARQCWYDVIGEFEACARDNINCIEKQFKQSVAVTHFRPVAATQRAKAAAE